MNILCDKIQNGPLIIIHGGASPIDPKGNALIEALYAIQNDIVEDDGFVNLAKANIVAINGLDGYALPSLKQRIEYQRPKK